MELRDKIGKILVVVKIAHDSFKVVDHALNRIMKLIDTDRQTSGASQPEKNDQT